MKQVVFAVFLLVMTSLTNCLYEGDSFVEYDIDAANQVWEQYDEHFYVKRTLANNESIDIADKLINSNEIFLFKYWDPFIYDEDKLDWSEDPFDDKTWQFYFHSLRMVSYLINAYELTGELAYLEKARWFIESWIEHNPNPYQQASERAWDDHSTANRITTFIYFWDYYRDSQIFDNDFANEFLNMLRKHGEYTAKEENYSWGKNHGIYQDRSLMQLAVFFPIYEISDEWYETSVSRLSDHLTEDITPSGIHKEQSTSYHKLVLTLFMSISKFNDYYNITNDELTTAIYKMQEYLVHLAKPDGTIPLVGDSVGDYVLGYPDDQIINEYLLYSSSDGTKGVKIGQDSVVYEDAGIAIFKNDWEESPPLYFALFDRFHMVTKHKQCDDLSFVLTVQDTDYFVDSGKYNYDEKDPYRVFVRSVFAHNSIVVDDESYDINDKENVGKTDIEQFEINSDYSYVKASHTLYDGVKITRTVIFFNDGAAYFHDEIKTDEEHEYTQIFNIGEDVNVDYSDTTNVFLSSKIDNTSLTLKQLNDFSEFDYYHGSTNPIMGWQSTVFNEISPISSISYHQEGKDVSFHTVINIESNIIEVDNFQDGDTDVYVFEFDDNRTERIEIK